MMFEYFLGGWVVSKIAPKNRTLDGKNRILKERSKMTPKKSVIICGRSQYGLNLIFVVLKDLPAKKVTIFNSIVL